MEDLTNLAGLAQSELVVIDEELDLQTEKYIELQKKLGNNRAILDRSWLVLGKLQEATKMQRIFLMMFSILGTFIVLLLLVKHGRLP